MIFPSRTYSTSCCEVGSLRRRVPVGLYFSCALGGGNSGFRPSLIVSARIPQSANDMIAILPTCRLYEIIVVRRQNNMSPRLRPRLNPRQDCLQRQIVGASGSGPTRRGSLDYHCSQRLSVG